MEAHAQSAAPSTPSRARPLRLLSFIVLVAVPLTVLADTARCYRLGWRPLGGLDRIALGGFGAWLALGLLASFVPAVRDLCETRLRRLVPTLLGLVLATLVAEGLAKSVQTPQDFHLHTPGLVRVHQTDPSVMPGIAGPARYTVNSRGIRGPDWDDEHRHARLLCVGGSATDSLYLDDAEAWTTILMERLAREQGAAAPWIGAVGLPGYSTVHHQRFLETSDLVAQVDCVFLLVGVNDFWKALMGVTPEQQLGDKIQPPWGRSLVVAAAHRTFDRVRARWFGSLEDWGAQIPVLREQRRGARIVDSTPDLAQELALYAQRIEALASLCRARGVRVVFATQPVLWRGDLTEEEQARLWFGWTPDESYLSSRALREGMDQYNATLLATCQRLGAECIDLAALNGREDLFYDDCHFDEAGARAAAERIGDWFVAHPIERR